MPTYAATAQADRGHADIITGHFTVHARNEISAWVLAECFAHRRAGLLGWVCPKVTTLIRVGGEIGCR